MLLSRGTVTLQNCWFKNNSDAILSSIAVATFKGDKGLPQRLRIVGLDVSVFREKRRLLYLYRGMRY